MNTKGKTKKMAAVLLTVIMTVTLMTALAMPTAAATSGICGENLTWRLVDGDTLNIRGTGSMTNYDRHSDIPWVSLERTIKNINIGNDVTTIGNSAFEDCDGLITVTMGNVVMIGEWAFYSCDSLATVTIPNSVKTVGSRAFHWCKRLNSVTIGSGVIMLGEYAFAWCDNLTTITIPDSVMSIGVCAFSNCVNLNTIIVDKNNSQYSSENGVLFDKNKSKLIQYPNGKIESTYKIPNSVVTIGELSFTNCDKLTAVTIPDNVMVIEAGAFYSCENLNEIMIPNSMKEIGTNVFSHCDSLTDVYYAGSQAEWEAIKIEGGNEALLGATIHFDSVSNNESTEIKVLLNGKAIKFDVQPVIVNERTMVPVRAIFEALGASVAWDEAKQKVTAVKAEQSIELIINSTLMRTTVGQYTLDSPAIIGEGRTLVPVRAISEAFGCTVDWIAEKRQVVIKSDGI